MVSIQERGVGIWITGKSNDSIRIYQSIENRKDDSQGMGEDNQLNQPNEVE